MEKRKLTNWQKGVIAIGAFIIILFLFYLFGISPLKYKMQILVKREIPESRKNYETAIEIKNRYLLLQKELPILKSKIAQRSEEFDLSAFVTDVQNKLDFIPARVETPRETTINGKYKKQRVTYTYQNKTLEKIVEYLYEIENPEHAIIIESLRIDPDRVGKKFTINITMSVISSIEGKE